jgi:MauM/NapG family ferredoxin protein
MSGNLAIRGSYARQSVGIRPSAVWRRQLHRTRHVRFSGLVLTVALGWRSAVPGDLFLRFDPLVWTVGSVASREIAPHALAALMLVAVTLLFGRVFCGWVCPLGALIDVAETVTRRIARRPASPGRWNPRFWILAAMLGLAMAGSNLTGWLDPLVLAARAACFAVRPATAGAAALLAWALVVAVVGLTFFAPRYWCRKLCPLGTSLSLAARRPLLSRMVSETCNQCGACSTACPMGRAANGGTADDCIVCRRCEAACPRRAVGFGFRAVGDPSSHALQGISQRTRQRRHLMVGLLAGCGGIALGAAAGFGVRAGRQHVPLRPPGASVEPRFTARCVGCGICTSVCPTGGLRPLRTVGRVDAIFTPELVPRIGPCLPECVACGEACPTGAIPKLSAAEKAAQTIGSAEIDRAVCLPWVSGHRCVICVDACPAEFHAVELRSVAPRIFRPFVEASRCTGCGICEYRCPVENRAAIRVRPKSNEETDSGLSTRPGISCGNRG